MTSTRTCPSRRTKSPRRPRPAAPPARRSATYHARNADGSPNHDPDTYLETIRKIRAASDILVHPTLGQVTLKSSDEARLRHIVEASKTLGLKPDCAPIDIGSTTSTSMTRVRGR